jgi:hypothetical protein
LLLYYIGEILYNRGKYTGVSRKDEKMTKCGCGCGQRVKKGNSYIYGHNNSRTKLTNWDRLCAMNAMNANNYYPITDDNGQSSFDGDGYISGKIRKSTPVVGTNRTRTSLTEHLWSAKALSSNEPSPEEALIEKESNQNLSNEARYVIDLCLNTPAELVDTLLTPALKKLTLPKLKSYLTKLWKSPLKANAVVLEIKEYLNIC